MTRRNNEQFIVRFPDGWRGALKARAARNHRSLNAEILATLESAVKEAAGGDLGRLTPAATNESAALQGGVPEHLG